jgi:hypothetical protein
MVVVPPDTPLTTPVPELTVAILLLLLVHDTPGDVALLNDVDVPAQIVVVPVIAAGLALTVYITLAAQPVLSV